MNITKFRQLSTQRGLPGNYINNMDLQTWNFMQALLRKGVHTCFSARISIPLGFDDKESVKRNRRWGQACSFCRDCRQLRQTPGRISNIQVFVLCIYILLAVDHIFPQFTSIEIYFNNNHFKLIELQPTFLPIGVAFYCIWIGGALWSHEFYKVSLNNCY